MKAIKQLRAEVLAAIEAECELIGFKKLAYPFFRRQLSADILGGLSFVLDTDGELIVIPSVSVRHQPLERLLAELCGEKFHPYRGGSLACMLGYVPPLDNYIVFEFPSDADVLSRVREMVGIARETALPWMQRHLDLDSFIADLPNYRFALRDSARLRLPVAYYLKGQFDMVRKVVAEGLAEIGDRNGELVAQPYKRFAETLLARLPA
jgi:hypothetical protein